MHEFKYDNVEIQEMIDEITHNLEGCDNREEPKRSSYRNMVKYQSNHRTSQRGFQQTDSRETAPKSSHKNLRSDRSLNKFRIKQALATDSLRE